MLQLELAAKSKTTADQAAIDKAVYDHLRRIQDQSRVRGLGQALGGNTLSWIGLAASGLAFAMTAIALILGRKS